MNRKNFKLVLDKIESDPSCWNQRVWHCRTQHCFAGWAQILSGNKPDNRTVEEDAMEFLGLSRGEAHYFFNSHRTLEDFRKFLERGGREKLRKTLIEELL